MKNWVGIYYHFNTFANKSSSWDLLGVVCGHLVVCWMLIIIIASGGQTPAPIGPKPKPEQIFTQGFENFYTIWLLLPGFTNPHFSRCVAVSVSKADDHEYRLVRDLLRNYDPRIRPSKNSSEALNVTFGLALAQIIDVVSACSIYDIVSLYWLFILSI